MTALTFGCLFSDRIEAFLDGRVSVAGFDITYRILEAQRLFRSTLRDAAFDIAELSMASHIAAVAAGRRDYVGIPAFLSRSFRHANLYVRTDRIARPEELAGGRIGVIDYQQTAGLWVRGILSDAHGVARDTVDWVAAGLHTSVLEDRTPLPPPPGIRLRRSSETLDQMLRDGALDAIISPTAPRCLTDPSVPVARMWPDTRAQEEAWWERTGIFPIMHLAVVRRSLVEAHPQLPAALLDGFEAARSLAATDLAQRDFPKVMLPWLSGFARDAHSELDGDPWTYGIEPNRHTLDTMLRYAQADGLSDRCLCVRDLFE